MAPAITPIPYRDAPTIAQAALPTPRGRPLLAGEWRNLVMLNFEIDPAALAPHIPHGTELDFWRGDTFVSVVGFQFLRAALFGVRIPLHGNFEEVNLRFYVRRRAADGWRRGVVFIREMVPKRTVAWTARAFGENFRRVAMTHDIVHAPGAAPPHHIEYRLRLSGRTHRLALHPTGPPQLPLPDSLDAFIAEHHWAYTALPCRRTREHFVVHPPWKIAPAARVDFDADVRELYGPRFAPFLSRRPTSAFWADGSAVRVFRA